MSVVRYVCVALFGAVIYAVLATALTAEVPGFAIWQPSDFTKREAALSKTVAADHSSRETLAEYKDHRVRLLYRDADGLPEEHSDVIDIVIVNSGEGTLLMGGTMLNRKKSGDGGTTMGTGLEGAERHPLVPGTVAHIPKNIPHSFLVPKGKHITYTLVKFP